MMHNKTILLATVRNAILVALFAPAVASAFDSGSTGVDGAFNPTVDTVLQLPSNGIFNFTNVNIPAGVTVSFQKNTTNTPVTLLASGDVVVEGTLHVSAGWSAPVGAAGDGNIGDDGLPGEGGSGGYSGGRGGEAGTHIGGAGHGPGAGRGGSYYSSCGVGSGGGGGGFGTAGADNTKWSSHAASAEGGSAYGSELILPLVGGSGGGGAGGGEQFHGSGGGGGGGAILIAASGTVRITGAIRADGGGSGAADGSSVGGTGGGGSGGAIRIVATRIEGNGAMTARGGAVGTHPIARCRGGIGGAGRIRLEAETFSRTAGTTPDFSFGEPSIVFVAGLPTLRITKVAGVAAPTNPTGEGDIILPADTANPVTVDFETTGVPVGNTVKLTVTPAYGAPTSVVSPALDGTTDRASASVSVNIPDGPSVLLAETTYTIVASLGDALSTYAQGERVERIRLAATAHGESQMTLITISGKEYLMPERIPFMPAG